MGVQPVPADQRATVEASRPSDEDGEASDREAPHHPRAIEMTEWVSDKPYSRRSALRLYNRIAHDDEVPGSIEKPAALDPEAPGVIV